MDKTVAGLLGVVGALVAGGSSQAATAPKVLEASSYADLLKPIPNALETLKALDAATLRAEQVQYYPYYPPPPPPFWYRHHHHHHHNWYRQRYYHNHHHHHHHHHGFVSYR